MCFLAVTTGSRTHFFIEHFSGEAPEILAKAACPDGCRVTESPKSNKRKQPSAPFRERSPARLADFDPLCAQHSPMPSLDSDACAFSNNVMNLKGHVVFECVGLGDLDDSSPSQVS